MDELRLENRFITPAADLSGSINVVAGSLWGHYNIENNPAGTRFKAAIQEAGNASTAIGLISQNASLDPDKFAGVWALSGTYGAFTPLMYLPARVWSQQSQDNPFRMGVLHILAGHSGPETAADARTHFGIFSPQVWKLFPRGQAIHLSFWDYNDVAPGYFAAAEIAARDPKVSIIIIEVARPDAVAIPAPLTRSRKGLYVIHVFAPGKPRHGYVIAQVPVTNQPMPHCRSSNGGQRQDHRRRRGTLYRSPPNIATSLAAHLLRHDGGEHNDAPRLAHPQCGAIDRRLFTHLRLARRWLLGVEADDRRGTLDRRCLRELSALPTSESTHWATA